MSQKTIEKQDTKIKIRKPKMYKVIVYNDDYTTMEFVVKILIEIFKKSVVEATKIMYDVHRSGIGIAGIYSYDIAVTKTAQAMDASQKSGFPLKFSIEEE